MPIDRLHRYTHTDTQTDANRFSNLSHAIICYNCGIDKNQQLQRTKYADVTAKVIVQIESAANLQVRYVMPGDRLRTQTCDHLVYTVTIVPHETEHMTHNMTVNNDNELR